MPASRPNNEAIFHAARGIPDPERRREYVREACGGDEARAAHVEALLAAADAPDSLLDRPAGGGPAVTTDQPTERPGTVIGPYKLLQQIGEGGMGTVWMAEQQEPVRRKVALKLIKLGMDTRHMVARFEQERQALALMDHPGIARVFDGGATTSGRPYFVMELVKGVPITHHCDEYRLPLRERLGLFVEVCHALQHAHQKGVIHRDIKPSNVLVAPYDGRPQVKVIDFGVAKAAGQSLTEKTLFTEFGAVVGTLEYMSPEQAELNNLDIDTRSDVYSLGVLLYELLTGTTPFQRHESGGSVLEMLRVIREQEPTRPSAKLHTAETLPELAARRGTEPTKLTRLLRGELDWVVLKALEKDRSQRYETPSALAQDVRRYLADEQVLACPPSLGRRVRRFARRNKAALAGGAVLVAAVLAVVIGLAIGLARLARERNDKVAALEEAEANLVLARQAVDEIYKPVAAKLSLEPGMQTHQRDVLEKALRFYEEFARRNSADPAIEVEVARAALAVVEIRMLLGQGGPLEQDSRDALARLERLGSARPPEPQYSLVLARANGLLAYLSALAGRIAEARRHHLAALAAYAALADGNPDSPQYLQSLILAHVAAGNCLADRPAEAEVYLRKAVELGERLVARWPEERFNGLVLSRGLLVLGTLLGRTNRLADAEAAIRRSLTLTEEQDSRGGRERVPSLPTSYVELGKVLRARGQLPEAEKLLRQAVALAEDWANRYPDLTGYRHQVITAQLELVKALRMMGRADEAKPIAQAAVERADALFADLERNTGTSEAQVPHMNSLRSVLLDAGELDEGERLAGKLVALAKKLAEATPHDRGRQFRLADAYRGHGIHLQRCRRFPEAAQAHREAAARFEALVDSSPEDHDYRFRLASSLNFLGVSLRQADRSADAVAPHRRAADLCERLVAGFSDCWEYRQQLVRSHYALGLALCPAGRWQEAEVAFERAVAESAPLLEKSDDPNCDREPAPAAHNALAWFLATCPDVKRRDPRRAVELA